MSRVKDRWQRTSVVLHNDYFKAGVPKWLRLKRFVFGPTPFHPDFYAPGGGAEILDKVYSEVLKGDEDGT